MRTINKWRVDIMFGENDGKTYAEARLLTEFGDRLVGVGRAFLSPGDYNVPEIGDEVAAARALRDLSERLLDTASNDISGATLEEIHLAR